MEEAEPLLISLYQGPPSGRVETGANSHWCLRPARNITYKSKQTNKQNKNTKKKQENDLSMLASASLQLWLIVFRGTVSHV